ncbi:MAG: sialidase family protein [Thermoleophilia bacterium]
MNRLRFALIALAAITFILVLTGGATAADPEDVLLNPKQVQLDDEDAAPPSGTFEMRDVTYGNAITECPQAGLRDTKPKPLDRRAKDEAEKRSDEGSDNRANQDYSCFPQDETSIDVSPTTEKNVVGGANDYRLGWGTSGFYSSTDNGEHWYDGIIPFPSLPSGDNLDGGGDPAIVFDREGTVYYADINFNRTDDTSGVWVSRSTNGGFTWSRPCVALDATGPPNNLPVRCGGTGDPRQPGDGTVAFTQDDNSTLDGSVPGHDKEYIAAGPRPSGIAPVCFTPTTHTPGTCPADAIGPDRLYVTWTIFNDIGAQILLSYSDDRAHSWSNPKVINGGAAICVGAVTAGQCDDNQFSVPTVNPVTGFLYVAFENFDTPDENQYLGVRSYDGGTTFQGPFFITPVFDVNYPRSGSNRTDCTARGQGGRSVLTNSCFRVNSGGNVVADKRGGAFADDLYVVMSDNRNGSRISSNTDVFLFKSTNGGATWIGPTRVNDDPSRAPVLANPPAGEGGRDCGRIVGRICPASAPNFGNDNWYPWVDISEKGDLNVGFEDRRLDTSSTAGEWPVSRAAPNGRPGNYLVWFFGAQCGVNSTATVGPTTTTLPAGASECLGNEASVIAQPATPINPSSGSVIPGQHQTTFPFDNFQISDTASNWDYSFRAGIFAGDYSGLAVEKNQASALWTDARNGRGSGGPATFQPGRNPICEQSDVFFDRFSAGNGGKGKGKFDAKDNLFLVTPCPDDIKDKKSK